MISKKKKVTKKSSARQSNPSNLKWKLDDYVRTQKITANYAGKLILDQIELDLKEQSLGLNLESEFYSKILADIFASKSYYYKQLQNIIAKYKG